MREQLKQAWEDLKETQKIVAGMDEGQPGPLGHYVPYKRCRRNHGMFPFRNLYSDRYEYGYCQTCQRFRYLTLL